MSDEQIKDYLQKYNITSKELLAKHIEQLKTNTRPNVRLISELVYILEDSFFSFSFGEKVVFDTTKEPIEMFTRTIESPFLRLLQNPNSVNDIYQELKKCSNQCFCDGSCKNLQKNLNQHVSQAINTPFFLDEVLESKNTNSTRHKSREGETHVVGYLEGINEPKSKEVTLKELKEAIINNVELGLNMVEISNISLCNDRQFIYDFLKRKIAEKETKEDLVFTKDSEINKEEGKKTNKNKPQISILFKQFPKALEAITMCSQYGHEKYKETDSDYLNFSRVYGGSKTYADAGLRHRLQQGIDLESGLPHQYHVAWNALAELQLWMEENIS